MNDAGIGIGIVQIEFGLLTFFVIICGPPVHIVTRLVDLEFFGILCVRLDGCRQTQNPMYAAPSVVRNKET